MCSFIIIHTSPMEGIFSKTPHPSENSNWASYISFDFFAFKTPPTPRNFQSLLWVSMDISWNYTIWAYSPQVEVSRWCFLEKVAFWAVKIWPVSVNHKSCNANRKKVKTNYTISQLAQYQWISLSIQKKAFQAKKRFFYFSTVFCFYITL